MKLIVNPHKIEIEKSPVNEKEINITKVEFEFDEEITQDYVKEAYFTLNGKTYMQLIVNNECNIPYEVLNKQGQVEIGVVAYLVENDEEIKRYNPSPVYISTLIGSLKEEYENTKPITPSDKEQMEQAIQEMETKVDNLDIDATKEDKKTTITITKKDGTTKNVEVDDGADGVSLEYNWSGTNLGIKREDEQNYQYVNLKGDTGAPGQIKMLIVNELPLVGSGDTLYFVPKQDPETSDLYDEYTWLNNKWERLGEKQIDIDLDDYYTKQETNDLLDNKQDEITQTNKLDYSLLDNTPTIPSKTSDLTNDSDFTTKSYVDGLVGDIATTLDEIQGEVI
jgi:hypothetical protein